MLLSSSRLHLFHLCPSELHPYQVLLPVSTPFALPHTNNSHNCQTKHKCDPCFLYIDCQIFLFLQKCSCFSLTTCSTWFFFMLYMIFVFQYTFWWKCTGTQNSTEKTDILSLLLEIQSIVSADNHLFGLCLPMVLTTIILYKLTNASCVLRHNINHKSYTRKQITTIILYSDWELISFMQSDDEVTVIQWLH